MAFLLLGPAAAFAGEAAPPPDSASAADKGRVEILRDRYGVPHIFADSLAGACFGQGYCHAQDNLEEILGFYLEARGEAAKTLGQKKLEGDYFKRVFHIGEISRRLYEAMAPEERGAVDAYAAGINRFLADHPDKRPNWFAAPVTGLDVVAAGKTYQLSQQLTEARRDLTGVATADRMTDEASNMWAIGPKKSKHGEVMLASDPHLPWQGLTQWHEAHLVVGDRWIYGATFFGFPGVAIGFTQDLAWGSTNNSADTADVYREELDPANPNRYRYEGDWRPIVAETLRLEVREPDGTIRTVERTVRRTHHGPLLQEDPERGQAFALRLAGLEDGNLVAGWIGCFHATRLADLEKVFDAEHPFKWHRIAADRFGDIGYYYFASTHQRSDDVQWNAPVDGASAATEWGPPLSWRDMPHLVNPPSGYLVNCNNNSYTVTRDCPLKPESYPRHLMSQKTTLTPDTRAYRAIELIEECGRLDFADLERIATDIKALTAQPYIDRIVSAYEQAGDRFSDPDGRLKRAVETLKSWDGMATPDNQALPILAACLQAMAGAGGRVQVERLPPQAVLRGLSGALDFMEKEWGSREIPWGQVHVVRRGATELPMPGAGNVKTTDPFTTLFMAGAKKIDGGRLVCDSGSSWTQLVKFHEGGVEAKTILPYGVSNDPASPHFADQMPLFAKRQLKQALLTRGEIEAAAESRTTLVYQP
ncbi:MAG: penicillin acylase family protein [Candidatus Sumerlaeota bacterium]|nr:penicillin acylase family protein [Candidatus Sumerlaeota bacterium]